MPYAKEDTISQDYIEGGIKITQKQYAKALQDKLNGQEVKVVDNKLTIIPQEKTNE